MPQPTPAQAIVGTWRKTTHSQCSEAYPDHIEFQAGKLYFGGTNTPGTFMRWDVGTYVISGSDEIRLSTANDEIVSYRFSLVDAVLRFTDPEGCEFSYHKE